MPFIYPFSIPTRNYRLGSAAIRDNGSTSLSSMIPIGDISHQILVEWAASTAPNANNGRATLWIDGVQRANLTGVDNDTERIESIRMGSVGGIDTGTRGVYYFDGYELWR